MNRLGTVSGWGRLYSGGPTSPELQFINVEILDTAECHNIYPHIVGSDTLLCGRGTDDVPEARSGLVADACQGDSGGPLVVTDADTGLSRIVGIVTGRFIIHF